MKEVDERLPECPDVEEKWEEIAKAYIPDGIREFQNFPSASLGWMMYIGDDLYAYLRDKRGYDHMDEYIREEVLQLSGADYTLLEKQTGECASRVYNALVRQHIAEGVAMGYSHIFCIIDMDTKDKEPERSQYQKLKAKYAKPINKPKKGIYCEVEFFETHPRTELFFLYYFRYTSRPYDEHEPLLKDLNKCVEYRKTIEFFIKTKGLHGYFERNGGSLEKAMVNANRSVEETLKEGRDYTYSELGRLMKKLRYL